MHQHPTTSPGAALSSTAFTNGGFLLAVRFMVTPDKRVRHTDIVFDGVIVSVLSI